MAELCYVYYSLQTHLRLTAVDGGVTLDEAEGSRATPTLHDVLIHCCFLVSFVVIRPAALNVKQK